MKKRFLKWLLKDTNLEFSVNNVCADNSTFTQCSINLDTYANIIVNELKLADDLEVVIRKIK